MTELQLLPVEMVELDKVWLEQGNPNAMGEEDFAQLVENMKRHGFLQPLLVRRADDGHLHLVDGEHRMRAAKELGATQLPAVVCDKDEQVALALRIGMNKLRGSLDLSKVAHDAAVLFERGWSLEELKLTGYSAEELDDLISSTKPSEPELGGFDDPTGDMDDPDGEVEEKPWSLELKFATKKERDRCKRALKKAAGDAKDPGLGLLNLLESS